MYRVCLAVFVLAVLFLPLAATAETTISVSPTEATVLTTQTQDFVAVVTGTANKNVKWKVCDGNGLNCVLGGNNRLGTIVDTGLTDVDGNHIGRYTAPTSVPSSSCTPLPDGCQVRVRANLTGSTRRRRKRAFAETTISPLAFVLGRVSVASDGGPSNSFSGEPSVSADGRFVAFWSDATNLVPDDTNFARDVFVRDTCQGADASCVPSTLRVSVASYGSEGNGWDPSISADGRFIAFISSASNLVPGDTNDTADVFVRDTCVGAIGCTPTTLRVSLANDGAQANDLSQDPSISADGRFVAFWSFASNLVADDSNGFMDIFVRDTCLGAIGCTPSTLRASVASDGSQADNCSSSRFIPCSVAPKISADGRFVAFTSYADNLVADDTNNWRDVFVRDTCVGAIGCTPSTVRVSVASDGTESNLLSWGDSLSADGRFVVFHSDASNLVPDDTNGWDDIFVHDTCVGAPAGCVPSTVRVSVASDGTEGNRRSRSGSISADGRFVTFESYAKNLVGGDTNDAWDILVRDTCLGAPDGCVPSTVRASVARNGTQGDGASDSASISADGRFVALRSDATNFLPGEPTGPSDVLLARIGR